MISKNNYLNFLKELDDWACELARKEAEHRTEDATYRCGYAGGVIDTAAEVRKRIHELDKDFDKHIENISEFKTAIESKILHCIVKVTGLENPNEVKLGSKFKEDLDMDNIDLIELHMRLEESFSIKITDEQMEKFKTVKDIVDFVEKEEAR